MDTPQLKRIHVACLASDGFEESELTETVKALKNARAKVDIISLKPGKIQAFKHQDKSIQVDVTVTLDQARPGDYQALLLPGGALNADFLRTDEKVKAFVNAFESAKKPIAFICHAPWILISAGIAKGRKMSGYHTIQDDIRDAGAEWLDQEVVVDGNWVSSRQPGDIPAFNREMIQLIARQAGYRTQAA